MKTTAEDFKLFQEYCKEWQEKLNLRHYGIAVVHENSKTEDIEPCEAWVKADVEARAAMIGLSTTWDSKPTNKDLEKAVFHEMLELLLWDIRVLLSAIICSEVIKRKIHNVVRTLENLFFP